LPSSIIALLILRNTKDSRFVISWLLHGESSLYTVNDALDDGELRLSCKALEDLRVLRKKVIDGETS
jgi:hypothetical protein